MYRKLIKTAAFYKDEKRKKKSNEDNFRSVDRMNFAIIGTISIRKSSPSILLGLLK
jgi:hypothetical protein